MRLFEFAGDDLLDRLVTIIKTIRGRYISKGANPEINWHTFSNLLAQSGIGMYVDYEVMKELHEKHPILQQLIGDFDQDRITFTATGSKFDRDSNDTQDSQDIVDKIASSAAPKQLDKELKM